MAGSKYLNFFQKKFDYGYFVFSIFLLALAVTAGIFLLRNQVRRSAPAVQIKILQQIPISTLKIADLAGNRFEKNSDRLMEMNPLWSVILGGGHYLLTGKGEWIKTLSPDWSFHQVAELQNNPAGAIPDFPIQDCLWEISKKRDKFACYSKTGNTIVWFRKFGIDKIDKIVLPSTQYPKISPDGDMLLLASSDYSILQVIHRKEINVRSDNFANGFPLTSFSWSPDSRILALGFLNGTLILYSSGTKAFYEENMGNTIGDRSVIPVIKTIRFSPDSTRLAVHFGGSGDDRIKTLALTPIDSPERYQVHTESEFDINGRFPKAIPLAVNSGEFPLVAAVTDEKISFWDRQGKQIVIHYSGKTESRTEQDEVAIREGGFHAISFAQDHYFFYLSQGWVNNVEKTLIHVFFTENGTDIEWVTTESLPVEPWFRLTTPPATSLSYEIHNLMLQGAENIYLLQIHKASIED